MSTAVQLYKKTEAEIKRELALAKLAFPFQFHEHKFTQGMVYLHEAAIANRLDKVDPDWQFSELREVINGTSVVVVGALMVAGVTRVSTGSGTALTPKTDNPNMLAENVGNAYKGATTDAFKRAARLHGIGRYMLSAPKENEFKNWLSIQLSAAAEKFKALNLELDAIAVPTYNDGDGERDGSG